MLAVDFFDQARGLTRDQRNAFIASFLGWTMDSFDFCLILFVFAQIAEDLHTTLGAVTEAATLTLAARPVGALLFGLLALGAGQIAGTGSPFHAGEAAERRTAPR